MKSIARMPLVPQQEVPEYEPYSEEWYADAYNRFGLTKQDIEDAEKDSIEAMEELARLREEAGSDDDLDLDFPVSIPIWGGLHSIRGAYIIEEKLYLDEQKQAIRYTYANKKDGLVRNEATIFLKNDEKKLSKIITQLPYGLIDKKVTGIGATYAELHSKRNSIIVTPTRALALNKKEDEFLYVGTQERHQRATTTTEIKAYLNNTQIQYKKILVVADSIGKVIKTIQENNEDVYRNYFLLVDEIDTLQSDNHFRPALSIVIDYYFKFKLQRRALLSATVKGFTHPKLQKEPLTTIQSDTPVKRNINLFYTNNINSLLAKKITEISTEYPSHNILIAYNSVMNIRITIKLLPDELQNSETCSILCSEASEEEAGTYFNRLAEKNRLPRKINFMTCSYFAGIDIKDSYHLITVSNSKKVYSALPLNKIIQIYGRCRFPDVIYSDTILYNCTKKPLKNLKTYKDILYQKAGKIIELLNVSNIIKVGDKDFKDLFNRIEKGIIEKGTERLFEQQPFELVRKNISGDLEVSHFNIDALYEKMEAYSKLYYSKEGLYNHLKELYPTTTFHDASDNEQDDTEEASDTIKVEDKQRLSEWLSDIKEEIIAQSQTNDFSAYLDRKIMNSKRKKGSFMKGLKPITSTMI